MYAELRLDAQNTSGDDASQVSEEYEELTSARIEARRAKGISYYHENIYYAVCERDTIGSETHAGAMFDSAAWLASNCENPAADEVVCPPDVSKTRALATLFTNAAPYQRGPRQDTLPAV